jgi:hypothetical protein
VQVANTLENQVVNHRQVAFGVEEKNKASISLTTQEGDVVNLSFSNLNKYSESASKTETQDGTVGEFSVAAMSASKYSISVQGDLNEEEMAAIKKMADAITPIAQDFFSQNDGISLEQAAKSLSESMGVIKEAGIRLEQTVTQTYSETQTSQSRHAEGTPPPVTGGMPEDSVANSVQKPNAPEKGIRNPQALASAVVDSAFQKDGGKVEDPVVLRGLTDLMDYLKKRLQEFLAQHKSALAQTPQNHDAVATVSKPQPEEIKPAEAIAAPDKALFN